jgi:hypothetical protein
MTRQCGSGWEGWEWFYQVAKECEAGFLSPLPGLENGWRFFPRLAPWATFWRCSAAGRADVARQRVSTLLQQFNAIVFLEQQHQYQGQIVRNRETDP